MAAVGDPALESEAEASTVELKVAPAATRDEAWVLGSILLSTKVLLLAALVAVEAAPGASAREEACILRSVFSIKVSLLASLVSTTFGGMVPIAGAVAVATLVGLIEGLGLFA